MSSQEPTNAGAVTSRAARAVTPGRIAVAAARRCA